jgi:hypothetical protein
MASLVVLRSSLTVRWRRSIPKTSDVEGNVAGDRKKPRVASAQSPWTRPRVANQCIFLISLLLIIVSCGVRDKIKE